MIELYEICILKYPMVILDKTIDGIPFLSVVSDNRAGAYLACKHLIDNNHQKIAYLSSLKMEHSSSIRERYFGYLQALYDYKLFNYSVNDLTEQYLTHENGNGRDTAYFAVCAILYTELSG